MNSLADEIRNYLRSSQDLDIDDVSDDTKLFSTGLLDSFSMVELVAFLEKKIGSKIKAMDITLENFDSIENILQFVINKSE